MVIAARNDELGARLCALVNAVALARRLNLPFRFMWPPPLLDSEFNAVSSLESIFSQSSTIISTTACLLASSSRSIVSPSRVT